MDEVWLKRDSESKASYEVFKIYMAFGPKRSVTKTKAALGEESKSASHWRKEARKQDWKNRAEAHDIYLRSGILEETKFIANLQTSDNIEMFKKVRGYSLEVIEVLYELTMDVEVAAANRIAAARQLIAMTGYEPPTQMQAQDNSLSTEEKAAWLDALDPEDKIKLARMHAKAVAKIEAQEKETST